MVNVGPFFSFDVVITDMLYEQAACIRSNRIAIINSSYGDDYPAKHRDLS